MHVEGVCRVAMERGCWEGRPTIDGRPVFEVIGVGGRLRVDEERLVARRMNMSRKRFNKV